MAGPGGYNQRQPNQSNGGHGHGFPPGMQGQGQPAQQQQPGYGVQPHNEMGMGMNRHVAAPSFANRMAPRMSPNYPMDQGGGTWSQNRGQGAPHPQPNPHPSQQQQMMMMDPRGGYGTHGGGWQPGAPAQMQYGGVPMRQMARHGQ